MSLATSQQQARALSHGKRMVDETRALARPHVPPGLPPEALEFNVMMMAIDCLFLGFPDDVAAEVLAEAIATSLASVIAQQETDVQASMTLAFNRGLARGYDRAARELAPKGEA